MGREVRILRMVALAIGFALVAGACGVDSPDAAPESAPVDDASTPADPGGQPEGEGSTVPDGSEVVDSGFTTGSVPWFRSASSGHRARLIDWECPVDLEAVDIGVTCGRVDVPSARRNPGHTGRIEIPVMVLHAEEPKGPPVLFIDGGPGDSTIEHLEVLWDYGPLWALTENHDVILFDTRGSGFSDRPVSCSGSGALLAGFAAVPEYESMGQSAAAEAYERKLDRCARALARDFDHEELNSFTITDLVADIEDIRRALDIGEWSLYGLSYGTRVALKSYQVHPENVVSIALDSVLPPQEISPTDFDEHVRRSLAALDDHCESDIDCEQEYGDLIELYDAALDEVADRDLMIEVSGRTVPATESLVAQEVFSRSYSAYAAETIPFLLQAIAEGDQRAEIELSWGRIFDNVDGALMMVQSCADDVLQRSRPERDGSYFDAPYVLDSSGATRACELLGVSKPGPLDADPVYPDVPLLALAGDLDPVTPFEWGEELADRSPDGQFVLLEGEGHVAWTYCSDRIVADFFDRHEDPIGAGCGVNELSFYAPGDEADPLESFEPVTVSADGLTFFEISGPSQFSLTDARFEMGLALPEGFIADVIEDPGSGVEQLVFMDSDDDTAVGLIQLTEVDREGLDFFIGELESYADSADDPWTEVGGLEVEAHLNTGSVAGVEIVVVMVDDVAVTAILGGLSLEDSKTMFDSIFGSLTLERLETT